MGATLNTADDLVKRIREAMDKGFFGTELARAYQLAGIAADEIERLQQELELSGKRWKAAMEERDFYEKRSHEKSADVARYRRLREHHVDCYALNIHGQLAVLDQAIDDAS